MITTLLVGNNLGRIQQAAEGYRYGYQGEFAEEDPETGWNQFELRSYDARVGRWMTLDPAGQFSSPYLTMGNNPINRVDPDGGYSPPTDFINSDTNEHVYVDDGNNIVLEVNNEFWGDVMQYATSMNSNLFWGIFRNSNIRNDIPYTIRNVITGDKHARYSDCGSNCNTAAYKQAHTADASPGTKYQAFHILVDNDLQREHNKPQLATDVTGGINAINDALESGYPVVVGLAGGFVGNLNAKTQHFVVIVSREYDVHGSLKYGVVDNLDDFRPNYNIINKITGYLNGDLTGGDFYYFGITEVRPNLNN